MGAGGSGLGQGSHCILKLGVHLVLFLIFVPLMYSSIQGTSSFLGVQANFWGGGGVKTLCRG